MELTEIEKLMKLMQSHGFNQLEIEEDGRKIKLVQSAASGLGNVPGAAYLPPFQMQAPVAAPFAAVSANVDTHSEKSHANPAKDKSKFKELRSPFVGTFYSAPTPGADDFVQVGSKVKKGDTLCIIEAMKMMNEIEAEHDMTIIEVLVNNESPVEFDQPLFLYE